MKKLITLLTLLLLSGCADNGHKTTENKDIEHPEYWVNNDYPSQSVNQRVRFLVLHYTAVDDAESLRLLTQGNASAHYLVPSIPKIKAGKPVVLQLVPESLRAWHAGASQWNGRTNLNDSSIGIEIVNLGFSESVQGKHWYPFNEAQIQLLIPLIKDIAQRYQISPDNIVGHSDIAPQRKYDPGPLFPWQRLAQQGLGAWPDSDRVAYYLAGRLPNSAVPVAPLQQALVRYGYSVPTTGVLDSETQRVISAFQMHFRPANFSGQPDAETEAIALALVDKYRSPVSRTQAIDPDELEEVNRQ